MKRKHFTRPKNLNTFGNWMYCEIFTRNITISELASELDISRSTVITWMDGTRPIRAHRILEICAVMAHDMFEYNILVTNAMRAMPSYRETFYTQKEGTNDAKH